jgi:PAS domain S-box-containing protein
MSLLLVLGCGLVRWSLTPVVGNKMPLWTFVPGVMLAAWFGGFGPGLLALAASVLVADYFFMPPLYSFLTYDPVDRVRLLIFALMGLLINWLSQQRQSSLRALRESEQRFSSSFDASPLALTITSLATGRLLEVNDTFVGLTGYTRAEALGRTPVELGLWVDPEARAARLAQLVSQGKLRNVEQRFRMRDGTAIIALLSAELLRLEGETCVLTVIDEITDRKLAEERLQEAEQRYRNFIAQSSEGIWRCELSEPIPIDLPAAQQVELIYERAWLAECNDAMARQYGLTYASELVGKRLDEFLVRSDAANEAYLRAFVEARYRLIDGESRETDAAGNELFFLNNLVGQVEDGHLVRAWGTQRNVTERRQAVLALRTSEERYRTLIAQVRDYAIFGVDVAGVINTWNEGCQQVLGYSRAEFIGLELAQLFTPEDVEQGVLSTELRLARTTGSASNDRWMVRRNGERFWALGYTTALHDAAGNLLGFTKVMRDLTERQLMVEALRESEAQFRQLADAMPQIVWAARPDGIIDYYNRRGFEFIGLAPGKYGNRSWDKVLHPDDVQPCYAAWFDSIRTGRPFEHEYRFHDRQSGLYRWHLGRALPIRNTAGQVIRWFGTSTDIDDLKRANEERARLLSREQALRVQAEAANRLKDEFLATISHELRTPLHHILGNLGLLKGGALDTSEAERALATIERNARVQQQIVEDLLDTSHLVTTSLKLTLGPLDLRDLLNQAIETVRPAALAKQISLSLAPAHAPAWLQGDELRLRQVLGHLLSNALKFTPPGGSVKVTLEPRDAQIVFTVSDTGQGIAPEFLPQVFDRFSQQDSSSTRRYSGLGLGLALVKHIVELHGGTVTATSPGVKQGATFTVTLPVLLPAPKFEQAPVVTPAPAPPFVPAPPVFNPLPPENGLVLDYHPNLQGIRVLVVEHDEATRQELCRILQAFQAEVLTATSAQTAFAHLLAASSERQPHVLVCNINLPGEDGFEFLRRVRHLPAAQGGELPAVALTGFTSTKDRLRVLAAGFQMHVSQPIEPAELAVVIASLSERQG